MGDQHIISDADLITITQLSYADSVTIDKSAVSAAIPNVKGSAAVTDLTMDTGDGFALEHNVTFLPTSDGDHIFGDNESGPACTISPGKADGEFPGRQTIGRSPFDQ